jgi:ABC-type proline/glycine betaine transport system permease subunit
MMKMSTFFVYLSFLNFLDGVMTFIGVSNGLIEEINPLMDSLLNENSWLFLVIKGLLSLLLLFLSSYLKKQKVSVFLAGLTLLAVLIYTSVSFIHLFWLILL